MSRPSWPSTPWSTCSPQHQQSLERDVGIAAGKLIEYSPIEFILPRNPRVLIQHGTHDEIAPIGTVRRFRDLMVQASNDCLLLEYENAGHAFHYRRSAAYFDAGCSVAWLTTISGRVRRRTK